MCLYSLQIKGDSQKKKKKKKNYFHFKASLLDLERLICFCLFSEIFVHLEAAPVRRQICAKHAVAT
jgi:hypothetical protein